MEHYNEFSLIEGLYINKENSLVFEGLELDYFGNSGTVYKANVPIAIRIGKSQKNNRIDTIWHSDKYQFSVYIKK